MGVNIRSLTYRVRDALEYTIAPRARVIARALAPSTDSETIHFMQDDRFFQYSCRMAEYRGKIEGGLTNHASYMTILRDKLTPDEIAFLDRLRDAHMQGQEAGMAHLKRLYLDRTETTLF